jgi:hypothetical protein
MKTSELTGAALDWAVALTEGWTEGKRQEGKREDLWLERKWRTMNPKHYHPSTQWAVGGPIIERENIDIIHACTLGLSSGWEATIDGGATYHEGPTPLIAAMRSYVASKLGEEVEVPKELL